MNSLAVLTWLALVSSSGMLSVRTDFEGSSARGVEVDQTTRTIRFMPGGDPVRGWPCWWYFQITGINPGERITLRLRASSAMLDKPGAKPLSAIWAMPQQATFGSDGKTWRHTEPGIRDGEDMIYTFQSDAAAVYVAWGPPFTPSTALKLIQDLSARSPHAQALELCRSRGGRSVPMLRVQQGDRPAKQRFGVWVHARQHAWECGSSWVAQGFAEWLVSDDGDAAWLRQHAEIYVVPIMDIDNTATGNGGKDAVPHDHNRDWSEQPHWNETAAALRHIERLILDERMDVFLDLHNPGPGDPTFFFTAPDDQLTEPMIALRDRFIERVHGRISRIEPLFPMNDKPHVTGPKYSPLWRQISANWVSMHGNPHTVSLCLETMWNSPRSTTEGYRSVGANLARGVRDYLAERPPRP